MDPVTVLEVVEEAAGAALGMREEEGARLLEDLLGRIKTMEEQLSVIETRAPVELRGGTGPPAGRPSGSSASKRRSMRTGWPRRSPTWRRGGTSTRKWFGSVPTWTRSRKPWRRGTETRLGKRLGFLVQEMHREANTIASKANDLEIGHASVAIREEIERLREQLENVE